MFKYREAGRSTRLNHTSIFVDGNGWHRIEPPAALCRRDLLSLMDVNDARRLQKTYGSSHIKISLEDSRPSSNGGTRGFYFIQNATWLRSRRARANPPKTSVEKDI
jgi:hypothetical protein